MKDIVIIGLVGLLWEVLQTDGRELITVVLFGLLVGGAMARSPRVRDILVICGVGLLWETALAVHHSGITIALFALPPVRLFVHQLAMQRNATTGTSQRIAWSWLSPRRLRRRLLEGFAGLCARIKTRQFVCEFVAVLGMVSLGTGATVYLIHGLDVSRDVLGYGALSYALGAVGFKGLLYAGLVVPVLHTRLSPVWLATAQGLVSALSELGAAALFFVLVLPELSLPELVGFGAAAGIIEAFVIPLMSIGGGNTLGGTPVEQTTAGEWQHLGATPVAVMVFPVVERALTLVLHTSSRALVYASIVLANAGPALLAVSLFATVDGLAYYALLKKWRVLSLPVAVAFYAYVAVAAGVLSVAFWWLHDAL